MILDWNLESYCYMRRAQYLYVHKGNTQNVSYWWELTVGHFTHASDIYNGYSIIVVWGIYRKKLGPVSI